MLQIHEKIVQARVSLGLTQEEVADKLGVPRTTYKGWEIKTPSIDKVKRIAEALGLPIDYFFAQNGEKTANDIDPKYVRTIEDLNEMYKKEIARLQTELNEIKEIKAVVSEIKEHLGSSGSK